MTQFIFGARLAEIRCVTELVNVLERSVDIQFVVEAARGRNVHRLTPPGVAAATVRPIPRPKAFGLAALL